MQFPSYTWTHLHENVGRKLLLKKFDHVENIDRELVHMQYCVSLFFWLCTLMVPCPIKSHTTFFKTYNLGDWATTVAIYTENKFSWSSRFRNCYPRWRKIIKFSWSLCLFFFYCHKVSLAFDEFFVVNFSGPAL